MLGGLLAGLGAGTLSGWLTVVAVVGLAWYLRGASGGQAIEILRDQRDVLAARVSEQDSIIATLTRRVAELEAKTDVSVAITHALDPVVSALTEHEVSADARSQRMLDVLNMIAALLGPEPG